MTIIMLVGVSGLAGAGKDTVADFLVEAGFMKVGLADPLKRIARDVYAFTDEQLYGPSEARNVPDMRYPRPCEACNGEGHFGSGVHEVNCLKCTTLGRTYLTPREALQTLGSEWGRKCYPNTWTDLAIRTATQLMTKGGFYTQKLGYTTTAQWGPWSVVIPDVRFQNEVDAIKRAGGYVLRVIRPGAGLFGAAGQHGSETEQQTIPASDFDGVISNTGTLADLRNAVAYNLVHLDALHDARCNA